MLLDAELDTFESLSDNSLPKLKLSEIIDKSDVWVADGCKIISYNGCKKIAIACGIVLKSEPKLVCQPTKENYQQHIWTVTLGYKGIDSFDSFSFAEGEASKLNTGEIVKNGESSQHNEWSKIDSKYKSAMAYKRAYCKAILQLIKLVGVYSSVESQAFDSNTTSIEDYTQL